MRVNLLYVLLGGLLGTVCGFVLANSSHRNNFVQTAPPSVAPAPTVAADNQTRQAATSDELVNSQNDSLSDSEINRVVLQADQNPTDLSLQKNLGLALFRYALLEQKNDLLATSIRLMKRAAAAAQTDEQLVTTLADALMIEAQQKDNREQIIEARGLYQKAIKSKPDAADLHVKLGYTYYLLKPPDYRETINSLRTALSFDSKNEDALTFLIKVLVEDGQTANAALRLDELKKINANNASIPDLQIIIAQSQVD